MNLDSHIPLGLIVSLTQEPASTPTRTEVLEQLRSIGASGKLTAAEFRVLEYLVDAWLAGHANEVTGKLIAADVFGKNLQTYDSRKDSLVRVTVSSLRRKLGEYYSTEGTSASVMFQLPPVGYTLGVSRLLPLSDASLRQLWKARVLLEQRTPAGFDRALVLLDAVLNESPKLPSVVTLKAEILITRGMYGSLPLPDLKKARELMNWVLSTPSADWRAYLVDGSLRAVLETDWKGAFESFAHSLFLRPDECRVHPWHTACLLSQGRPAEAILNMRNAVGDRGYHIPTMRGDLSILEILGREYDAARDTIETTIELFPNYFLPYLHRALLLDACGDPHGALAALHETPLRLYERPVTWGFYAYYAGKCGQPLRAERRLKWMKALRRIGYVPGLQLAIAALGAGKEDEALEWLEFGWNEQRDPLLIWLHAYPFFDSLRGNRHFERLVDRIGIVRF